MDRLPTLRQLQHFIALTEHLHFGRAAAAVHVTQSTLSASLKELEVILGAPLVDRTKRSVVLTPLGVEIAGRARQLLAEAEDLAQTARASRAPIQVAVVRRATSSLLGQRRAPATLPGSGLGRAGAST